MKTINEEQAQRLRESFKRGAHVNSIIRQRLSEKPIKDEMLRIAVTLLTEEYDAIFSDFQGMLNGNQQKSPASRKRR